MATIEGVDVVMPPRPRAGLKNLSVAAQVGRLGRNIALGLDTHADVSFIKASLVPPGVTIRPASVAVRGVGAARAIGWVELEVELYTSTEANKPDGKRVNFTETFLVMPDAALPRDTLIGFSTMMYKLEMVLDAAKPESVRLLGQDFPLVQGDDVMFMVTGATMVVTALPAEAILLPIVKSGIEQMIASATATSSGAPNCIAADTLPEAEPVITCAVEEKMARAPVRDVIGIIEPQDDEELIDHFARFKEWTPQQLDELRAEIDAACNRKGMICSDETRAALKAMLLEYLDVFAPKLDPLTRARRPPVHIELE